mgnify:CR=1 FL=1
MSVDTIARGMAAEALSGGGSSGTASGTSYDPSASGLSATNVQAAIDELASGRTKSGSVTLSLSWSGSGPYTQAVTVTGATVTENSEVSLRPTPAQIESLITDGVSALVIENNDGTLTAYALGAAPSAAMTVACTVTEVEA